MKSLWFWFIVISLPSSILAQDWHLPRALETRHLIGPSAPVELQDEFYALGWNKMNYFAYLIRQTQPQKPAWVRFCLQDMVEDTILYEQTWSAWTTEDDKNLWWDEHAASIVRLLEQHDILPYDYQLGTFPMINGVDYYRLGLRTQRWKENHRWILGFEVVVHASDQGLKRVFQANGWWQWGTILGFLPSPFENRLALILLTQPSGWQGKKQPLRFLVTGTSLYTHFIKP